MSTELPRADLRTLATEALWSASPGASGTGTTYRELAEAVLAAVLPGYERQVAARERLSCWETLTAEARAWEATADEYRADPDHGDGDPDGRWATLTAQGYWSAANKLIPPNDLAALRRLAEAAPSAEALWTEAVYGEHLAELVDRAATSPATLSATVPAENAPAVPEEADGQRAGEGGFRLKRRTDAERADYLSQKLIKIMAERNEARADRDRLAEEVFTLTNSESLDVVAAELERDEARAGRDGLGRELREARTRLATYENTITWNTTCHNCAAVLDSSIRETDRAEKAEADRDRLADQVARHQRVVEAASEFVVAMSELHNPSRRQKALDDLAAAVDALPDAGTQPHPTPSDAKSGTDQTEDDHD